MKTKALPDRFSFTHSVFGFSAIAAAVLTLTMLPDARAAVILEYNFAEGSGSTVADSSGFGTAANGTLTGSWSSSTPSGSGFSGYVPGGANDGVATGSVVGKLNGLSQITGVLWLNLQAAPIVSDRLVSNLSASNGFDVTFGNPTSGVISTSNYTIALSVNAGSAALSTADITQSGWVFLAFTYDGTLTTNNLNYYWGTTTNSVAQLGSTLTRNQGVLGTSTNDFEVGNTALTTGDRTPNALFDNVQIYNTVLDGTALELVRAGAIPEPGTWVLIAGAGTFFMVMRRRRRD